MTSGGKTCVWKSITMSFPSLLGPPFVGAEPPRKLPSVLCYTTRDYHWLALWSQPPREPGGTMDCWRASTLIWSPGRTLARMEDFSGAARSVVSDAHSVRIGHEGALLDGY